MSELLSNIAIIGSWVLLICGAAILPAWQLGSKEKSLTPSLVQVLRRYLFLAGGFFGFVIAWNCFDPFLLKVWWGLAVCVLLTGISAGWSFLFAAQLRRRRPWGWLLLNLLLPFPGLILLALERERKKSLALDLTFHCFTCGRLLRGAPTADDPAGSSPAVLLGAVSLACQGCGTLFCLDCMVDLRKGHLRCPNCQGEMK